MTYHSSSAPVWMAIVVAASISMSGCCSGNPLFGTLRWGPGHKDECESPHCPTWTDCYGFHSTCWDRWPDDCQTCPPPVDPSFSYAPHLSPTPAPAVTHPPIPLDNQPGVGEGNVEDETTEEMPNPNVLEEPEAGADETNPPESEDEPTTTYLRPVKAKTSYYRNAKERATEQPHVAYLLPKPDVEPPSTSVRATPVRASISDESETPVSLPRPVFPKTRLVR